MLVSSSLRLLEKQRFGLDGLCLNWHVGRLGRHRSYINQRLLRWLELLSLLLGDNLKLLLWYRVGKRRLGSELLRSVSWRETLGASGSHYLGVVEVVFRQFLVESGSIPRVT